VAIIYVQFAYNCAQRKNICIDPYFFYKHIFQTYSCSPDQKKKPTKQTNKQKQKQQKQTNKQTNKNKNNKK